MDSPQSNQLGILRNQNTPANKESRIADKRYGLFRRGNNPNKIRLHPKTATASAAYIVKILNIVILPTFINKRAKLPRLALYLMFYLMPYALSLSTRAFNASSIALSTTLGTNRSNR